MTSAKIANFKVDSFNKDECFLSEINCEVLQYRLKELKAKLREYINETKIADEKVYQYSLKVEYLTSLLQLQKKIHSNANNNK